ncbi:MAG: hypothetical protein KDA84_04125, partial [Planctomycetaceae bacterium]|nr:hypothetical protein [Planctomycetaceae bacterium]
DIALGSVSNDLQADTINDESGTNQTLENIERTTFADGTQVAFLKSWKGRENVLLHLTEDGKSVYIHDNIVDWKSDSNGNVYMFRWLEGEQKDALLHWSPETDRRLVDSHVTSWEIASSGVYYFQSQSPSDGKADVLRHWTLETDSVYIHDNVVNWQVASDGSVYMFRWKEGEQDKALLHWSSETERIVIDDNVESWELTGDGVRYTTDGVKKSWSI